MATRTKAAKKQVKAPSKAKKAVSKKSPARILLPSGATDDDKKKATPRKSPARRKSGK
ncbi:histone H1 [Archangium violaceum]|uniref:histone H1 n=1 Tax=Archangium violaceum TaxID=83451 RepID=UPI001269A232|nr:histone H1 [Archangium violaceum]